MGALNWIMDIEAWANVVFRILKKGGRFYIFEGHPITCFFDTLSKETLQLDPEFKGYFHEKIYSSKGWPESYIKNLGDEDKLSEKHEKVWPISRIINALIKVGLRLECFEEHPDKFWEEFPVLKEDERKKFPNTFSLLMFK